MAVRGVTLVELILGAMVLAVAIAAILGAYLGQTVLNEHAQRLSLAIQDANRVIERLREDNATCAAPSWTPPGGGSWDAWLAGAGGGKSLPNAATDELVVLTCQNEDGTGGCPDDPIRVTVAVCWRHRGRTIGDCAWNGAALSADGDGVTVSPAMLTTLVTCR